MKKIELRERLDEALRSADLSYLTNTVNNLNNPFDYFQLIERMINVGVYRGIDYEEFSPLMLRLVESISNLLSLWREEDQYDR